MGLQRGSGALRHVTRIAGWLLIVSGLTTFAGAASMQQTSTPARAHDATDAFDALYERGRPIEATLRTIRARFTETTTSSLLVQPLVAEGTLVVRRPHEVVLRYSTAGREDAAARRGVAAPGLARAIDQGAPRHPRGAEPRAAVLRRQESRRAAPALHDHDQRRRRPARDLEDRDGARSAGRSEQGLAQIDLWVRRDTLLLSAMRLTFAGGDTKTMTFAEVVVNAPVTDADFEVR